MTGSESEFELESDPSVSAVGDPIGIANEFTGVLVRKMLTRNGERLEVTTPKSGHRVLLDAMQLEIISTLKPEAFTELIARRLGSHAETESKPK